MPLVSLELNLKAKLFIGRVTSYRMMYYVNIIADNRKQNFGNSSNLAHFPRLFPLSALLLKLFNRYHSMHIYIYCSPLFWSAFRRFRADISDYWFMWMIVFYCCRSFMSVICNMNQVIQFKYILLNCTFFLIRNWDFILNWTY